MDSSLQAPAAAPRPQGRFDVLGTQIDATDVATTVAALERCVREGCKASIAFCTASSVLATRDDPVVRTAFDAATWVVPDGMPLVWLGKRGGHDLERVYGPDVMIEMLSDQSSGLRHFFYGGSDGVAQEMARRLKSRFPHLEVAGVHTPGRISGRELLPEDVAAINASGADVVWVGLGHPKQELWMHTHRSHLDASVLAGVGAAFDVLSGRTKEAPPWVRKSGLQWAHRLVRDPRRLWKRYLVGNSRFLWLLACEHARLRS